MIREIVHTLTKKGKCALALSIAGFTVYALSGAVMMLSVLKAMEDVGAGKGGLLRYGLLFGVRWCGRSLRSTEMSGMTAKAARSGTAQKTGRQPIDAATHPAIAGPTRPGKTHARENAAKKKGRCEGSAIAPMKT